jgi:CHAT domain-containing protein
MRSPLKYLAALALLAACEPAGAHIEAGLLRDLSRTGTARMFAPRLSVAMEYRPCTVGVPSSGSIPIASCIPDAAAAEPDPDVLDLAVRAAEDLRTGADPGALHTVALIDLLWAHPPGNSVTRSIASLQAAARIAERPAPILADLAAAHIVFAEASQRPRHLLESVEAAERALELEPDNVAARFNLALALDRLALDGQAAREWRAYVELDSSSGWADEARGRLAKLEAGPAPKPQLPRDASPSEAKTWAAANRQEARLLGWDRLLGEWGAAVLRGDFAVAERKLRLAEALGAGLEGMGGDASLADAVRAIRVVAADGSESRDLARAHYAYATARAAYARTDYVAAGEGFSRVLAAKASSAPLRGWATALNADIRVIGGDLEGAERLYRRALAETDTVAHPALAGHAHWGAATTWLRGGTYERARDGATNAARHFARAGEVEKHGGALYLVSDAELALGARSVGYESMHKALMTLRDHRGSVWLHNLLSVTAAAAAADGLPRAAMRIQNEDVIVAARTGRRLLLAESRLDRAALHTASGDLKRAGRDAAAARVLIEEIDPGPLRDWMETSLRLVTAEVSIGAAPHRAKIALDSVIASAGGTGTQIRMLQALVGRAEAWVSLGNVPGAVSDLDRATALLREQRAAIATTPFRISLMEQASQTFDRLVMLQIGADRVAAALAFLERGRDSFAPMVTARLSEPQDWSVTPGSTAVEYAMIGDTLLIWTAADTTLRLSRSTIDRSLLTRTIERVRSSLEMGVDEAALRPDLARLHEWLINPVEDRFGPLGSPLVVVADGEISGVPFAALYDSRRRRYLAERHPLRFAGSMKNTGMNADPTRRDPRVLLVADPNHGATAPPGLGRLPGARAEVDAVKDGYRRTKVLQGSAATRSALESEFQRSDVLHFAGHAVFDDNRPEQSYLVVAPVADATGEDRLSAADLEGMDLRHMRLAVLSACQTLRATDGRSGGFAGFAAALLSAGAGGVLGSLWRVDDEATRALMVEFHRAYRESGNAPRALRAAQIRLRTSADPALRSPAAWAGFRYTGN